MIVKKNVLPGYHTWQTNIVRHRRILESLRRKKEGYMSLARHLQLLSTFLKRRSPRASLIFKMNSEWLKKKYK